MKHLVPLLFAFALYAQAPADAIYNVSGRVLDADTNDPIRGAVVSVHNNSSRAALVQSDATGLFKLINIKSPVFLSVAALGYVTHRLKPSVYNEPLSNKSEPINVSLYLQREAVIEGHVLDEAGKPIAGFISLSRSQYRRGRFWRDSKGGDKLTGSGRFRVSKIEPGDYWVYFTPEHRNPGIGFTSTIYPDPSGVRTIHLAPGQTETIELRIRAEKGYTIKGKVVAKISPLEVRLRREGAANFGQGGMVEKCNEAGVFSIQDVPAGEYIVEAASGATNEGYITRKTVIVGPTAPVVEVVLESPPVRELTARFILESGEPAPPRCCGVMLTGPSWNMYWEYDDLSQRLKNLNAGEYRVEINSRNHPVLSVRQGKIDALKNDIIIPATGPVAQLEIVLGPQKPLVIMQTTNGYPVYLDLLRVTSQGFEILASASHMAFPPNYQMGGKLVYPTPVPMTPGQYYIFARANSVPWPLPLEDPKFFEKYRSYANLVNILPGVDQTITLIKTITDEAFNQP